MVKRDRCTWFLHFSHNESVKFLFSHEKLDSALRENTINVQEHNLIQVLLPKGKTSIDMCSRE